MPSNQALLLILRHPLLVIIVLAITVFLLRALLAFSSDDSLGYKRSTSRTQISMLTYNIWFSPKKRRERIEALGQIVEDLEPDILVFQEVTLENLSVLKEQKWFPRYRLIPSDVEKKEKPSRHFVIILIVYAVEKWFIYPFVNSPRMRRLVVAETKKAFSSPTVDFVIAGTHLVHAGENTLLRELQLKESLKALSPYENVCVMGDLNIEDKFDGDIILPSPWIDAWLSLPGNTDTNGITWDLRRNPFASVLKKTVNATSYKARLDRVLCKLSDFKVKDMKVVGNKLTKSGILPSDHFGVFTVIEISQTTGTKGKGNFETDQEEVFFRRPPGWKKIIRQD